MPPTPLQILKMKVTAFKDGLTSKKASEKKGDITYAFGEGINRLIEEAKKIDATMADGLPTPIHFYEDAWGRNTFKKIDYIHAEIMLNQIIGTIDLFDKKD